MTNTFPHNGLQRLILDNKGDRSFTRLSKACGGVPTGVNLQRITTRPLTKFPGGDVLMGLSKGLGIRLVDVLHAAAISVGMPIGIDPGTDLNIKDAGRLPDESQELLRKMAENMLWWQEQAETVPGVVPDNVTDLPVRDWGESAADSRAGQTPDGGRIGFDEDPEDT